MDIVYVVREGESNEELRYSLRSLKNVPHGNVHIVGFKPHWVKNVNYIPRFQKMLSPFKNTTLSLLIASQSKDVSDDFILMNDDFYIMKNIESIPVYYNKPASEILSVYDSMRYNAYSEGLSQTCELLDQLGISEINSYELHIPMVLNKEKYIQMCAIKEEIAPHINAFHKRTFYGNYFNIGGSRKNDVKVRFNCDNNYAKVKDEIFISSSDQTFTGFLKKYLQDQFPEKSYYE